MSSNLYVALSAQIAADRRLATVANNVANMNTPGFRAEQVRFTELLSQTSSDKTSYVSPGETFTSLRSGAITQTGNPLDLAVEGEGWFAVRTSSGVAYTRDGRMRMTPEGALQTMSGMPVLDVGGAPPDGRPQWRYAADRRGWLDFPEQPAGGPGGPVHHGRGGQAGPGMMV